MRGNPIINTLHKFLIFSFILLPVVVSAFDPLAGDFRRDDPTHVRLLSYNVERMFIDNASNDDEFEAILTTINPDVIAFQEISTDIVTAADIKARMELLFPGETWTVHLGLPSGPIRNALATRFPLSMTITDTIPSTEIRGVTSGLVDLPDADHAADLYIMGVHFKSGGDQSDNTRRQEYADGIINWMRDARTPGEFIDLPTNTPMVVMGDYNVDFMDLGTRLNDGVVDVDANTTLLTGDILDEGRFGSDSAPDWDGSTMTDAAPYDHFNGNPRTQRSGAFPGSRLDRIFYTDSVLRVHNRAVFNTETMSANALSTNALFSSDTTVAADHLPLFVDVTVEPEVAPGQLLINEFIFDDAGADDQNFVEIINVGDREVNLEAPLDYQLLAGDNFPTVAPSFENQDDSFNLVGVIPPGGLFVLYSGSGPSDGVSGAIESLLPPLQRQEISDSVFLTNNSNSGLALVTELRELTAAEPARTSVQFDTLIDGYMYKDVADDGDHFFRTDSDDNNGDGLLITLGAAQRSAVDPVSDTLSFSRNVGDATPNSFTAWTLPDAATPGLPNDTTTTAPMLGDLIINEFIATPDASEAIELLNLTGDVLTISGVTITVSSDLSTTEVFTINTGVSIAANGYLVVDGSNSDLTGGENLPNPGATIVLSLEGGTELDRVSYGVQGSAPAPIFQESCARSPSGGDTDSNLLDWNLDDSPTMGATNDNAPANPGNGTVFLNEVAFSLTNTADHFVELYNGGGSAVDIGGWQILANDDFNIPGGTMIPAGGYYVLDETNFPQFFRISGSTADNVYLLNAAGERVDQIGWTSLLPDDKTLSVLPNGVRTRFDAHNDATQSPDWAEATPTSGAANVGEITIPFLGFGVK